MMIGVTVALLSSFNGRIAGISGIMGGLYRIQKADINWRVAFILSVVIWKFFFVLPKIAIETNYTMLAVTGFLVTVHTWVLVGQWS